ncbi:hypothetical protein ANO11243_064280 [Dothideomycetidae sp. 11243]|nr:hypothetical protein ANO11243_064280 [fungal sp. No.11243]
MESATVPGSIKPRIIIHGGAGNISPANLPPALYKAHHDALLKIVESTAALLEKPDTTALDAACYAVTLLELNPLYNASRGAVYTTAGRIEHEASVMVSDPHPLGPSSHPAAHPVSGTLSRLDLRKRACSSIRTSKVKHPILLAREILVRGSHPNGDGATGHNQLSGAAVEHLAQQWGLEIVPPSWFWERKRWDQHRRGLGLGADTATFEAEKRRTVGAVVLDRFGTLCTATSTGGMTNKLPGRVGDTPTIGAGFWAESWTDAPRSMPVSPLSRLLNGEWAALLPWWVTALFARPAYLPVLEEEKSSKETSSGEQRAVALSGTGNGDSFLRLCAARTVAAVARFSGTSLARAVSGMAGTGGALQGSAEDRWGKTGEGEGGIIGIELVGGKGSVVSDFNCGGMFRAWIDDRGRTRMMVFKDEYQKT